MTVAEYRRIPEAEGDYVYELHHGELVKVARPTFRHAALQHRIYERLCDWAGGAGVVMIEFAYRAVPEHDVRAADVGFVTAARAAAIDPEDNLMGAPDLVVEVLSPSNSAQEMIDKQALCLENGCREFWIVDDLHGLVQVTTSGGRSRVYRRGENIPLEVLPGRSLAVSQIFGEG